MALRRDVPHIFLADDDEDDCVFFEDALKELISGYKFTVAQDGIHAMKTLSQMVGSLPDLVFLDLNMPLKNGLECLVEIKHDENLKHLPVIIFSTSAQQAAIDKTYDLGAWFYLRKPETFERLKTLLKTVLDLRNQHNFVQPPKSGFLLTT
ncbi:MAG TPA: response regulator [Chryseosolibacter sp.]|nr:response regulator [Chryseosolibacter sp.]